MSAEETPEQRAAREAFEAAVSGARRSAPVPDPGAPPAGPTFDPGRLVSIEDFLDRPPTPALIEGTFTRRGVAQIVAASGSGKTFVALQLAFSLACNDVAEWFGRAINAHGPVVYYPTEGLDTIPGRAGALIHRFGQPSSPIVVVEDNEDFPLLTDRPEHRDKIRDAVLQRTGGAYPVAMIVDTQLGVMADIGVKENDNDEMHRALNVLRRVCSADALDCLLIMVHHTGHSPGDGRVGKARGASAQFGYMDSVVELHNLAPDQLGKGPYYVAPTKFKPDRPWEHREEFTFRELPGIGSYIEHVPRGELQGMGSVVTKARADRLIELLTEAGGGPCRSGDLQEEMHLSARQWRDLRETMSEAGTIVQEGTGRSTTIRLPAPDTDD